MQKRKIIVAHPFKQHSFQLAKGIEKNENLFAYCTTIYDKPNSLTYFLKRFFRKDELEKLNLRKEFSISNDKIHLFCEFSGYIALILNHYCPFESIKRWYQRFLFKRFGKKVANFAIKNEVEAIIMFDTTATTCFEILKKRNKNIKLILDMSAVSLLYAKNIYEKEEKKYNLCNYKKEHGYLWNDKTLKFLTNEINLADYFIVASNYTKKSLTLSNVPEEKIYIIPYGVDLNRFSKLDTKKDKNILNLIYVGKIDYRKGLHHLFNVMNKLKNEKVHLNLYGNYNINSQIYKMGKKLSNVTFKGFLTTNNLVKVYSQNDVFIFPSTNDGYGLVVMESMACGLPIICSTNAGASDLVKDGVNGFKFEFDNEIEMYDKIIWFIRNKNKIEEMGKKSIEIIKNYTWENYYDRINYCLNYKIFDKKEKIK